MSLALQQQGSSLSGSNARGNRESTVYYDRRAEMGIFTETRTAYLPVTFFLSVNNVRRTDPIKLRIRLDWPKNILLGNTLAKQEILYNGGNYTRARGLSNDSCIRNERVNADHTGGTSAIDNGMNKDQLTPFPCTIVGNGAANTTNTSGNRHSSYGTISDSACIPAYRKWYATMYDYAHCMETDYKVTYFSSTEDEFQNMLVYEGMDCVSDNQQSRIPDTSPLQKVMHWPHLKEHRIEGRTNERQQKTYTISGTWKDNMQYPMKMIPNEEDVKTWTLTSANDLNDRLLNYREELILLHYSNYDSTTMPAYYNVRVDLRYKVQFRDLSNKLRYLGSETGQIYYSDDCIQVPNAPEIVHANTITTPL